MIVIQISGAKVVVHDPRLGATEGMVIVSGMPDQIQSAQCLIHGFILCEQNFWELSSGLISCKLWHCVVKEDGIGFNMSMLGCYTKRKREKEEVWVLMKCLVLGVCAILFFGSHWSSTPLLVHVLYFSISSKRGEGEGERELVHLVHLEAKTFSYF